MRTLSRGKKGHFNGETFLRQLFENRDLPSSSTDDLQDRYRRRSPSPTPPTSPRRRSESPPPFLDRYANRGRSQTPPPFLDRYADRDRSETPPPFLDWHADRETPPLSRTSSRHWSPLRPQEADRDRSSVEETRGATLSPARDRNLIGMGIKPTRLVRAASQYQRPFLPRKGAAQRRETNQGSRVKKLDRSWNMACLRKHPCRRSVSRAGYSGGIGY